MKALVFSSAHKALPPDKSTTSRPCPRPLISSPRRPARRNGSVPTQQDHFFDDGIQNLPTSPNQRASGSSVHVLLRAIPCQSSSLHVSLTTLDSFLRMHWCMWRLCQELVRGRSVGARKAKVESRVPDSIYTMEQHIRCSFLRSGRPKFRRLVSG